MVPTAVLMLLDGSFARVPVTIDAFQPPPGSGSTSGAFLVAEHAISAYMVSSISLPELSRRTASTPLWYDFTSGTVKGISPIDGGYYLPPGFTNQEMSLGDSGSASRPTCGFRRTILGTRCPCPPAKRCGSPFTASTDRTLRGLAMCCVRRRAAPPAAVNQPQGAPGNCEI